jgi:hypothetical protein
VDTVSGICPVGVTQNEHFLSCDTVLLVAATLDIKLIVRAKFSLSMPQGHIGTAEV